MRDSYGHGPSTSGLGHPADQGRELGVKPYETSPLVYSILCYHPLMSGTVSAFVSVHCHTKYPAGGCLRIALIAGLGWSLDSTSIPFLSLYRCVSADHS